MPLSGSTPRCSQLWCSERSRCTSDARRPAYRRKRSERVRAELQLLRLERCETAACFSRDKTSCHARAQCAAPPCDCGTCVYSARGAEALTPRVTSEFDGTCVV